MKKHNNLILRRLNLNANHLSIINSNINHFRAFVEGAFEIDAAFNPQLNIYNKFLFNFSRLLMSCCLTF
jgi:hypothetical protein